VPTPAHIALAFLVLTGTAQAERLSAQTHRAEAEDTVARVRPRLFERRVFFSPEYLARIFNAARSRTDSAALARDALLARAGEYAQKYDIEEALASQIIETALAEGVDPDLAFRLVRTESVFRPAARGPGGTLGLTQLLPSTARAVDRTLRTEAQILDPVTNLRTGFRYLKMMIQKYEGDVRLGLLAYNRGEGTVDRALRQGRDPENGYSGRVLGSGSDRYAGNGLVPPD
jgi:soluble lytic murein transglycosylase-like protein